ncbi:MAG: hypothetical protein E7603_04615 [Ruminococcaceae bacterium]|nr:hypothetical protein [Oscillospiraceae bacterium]
MDKKQIKNMSNLRALGLTVILCILAVAAAADLEYGTHIIGHVFLMLSVGVLSVIFMTCDKAVFVLDAAALIAIIFFTSNGSLILSLFGAVIIFSAMLLAYAVRKKSAKTSAVLVVSITVTVGYLIVMAVFYAAEGGSLALEDLFEKLNGLGDSVKIYLADVITQSVDAISEEILAYYAKHDITKEMLLEASLLAMEDSVDWMKLLLPGYFVFLVQVMGYFGVIAFEKTVRIARCEAVLPEIHWQLYPTQVSCVIYIVITTVYIITSVFFSNSSFAVFITNFWLALMPVMIGCGFRSLYLRLKHPQLRRSTIFILILLGAGCFFIPDAVLTFGILTMTFMGAQDVFLSRAVESGDPRFREKK